MFFGVIFGFTGSFDVVVIFLGENFEEEVENDSKTEVPVVIFQTRSTLSLLLLFIIELSGRLVQRAATRGGNVAIFFNRVVSWTDLFLTSLLLFGKCRRQTAYSLQARHLVKVLKMYTSMRALF